MSSVRACSFCFSILWVAGAAGSRTQQTETIQNVRNAEYAVDPLLNVTQRGSRDGYSVGEHAVDTADGYVLRLFRVRRGPAGQGPGPGARPPVLLVPGLLQSGAAWVEGGPGLAPAYLLADAGHDVWLGNDRGSLYSRRHRRLDPDTDPRFWHFCDDEIGRYDLPAAIRYILTRTGAQNLNYIGFSQGTTTFFIMCSEVPKYCDKVNVMIALAPSARHLYMKSVPMRQIAKYCEKNERELTDLGVWEVLPHGGVLQTVSGVFCSLSNEAATVCELIKNMFDAPNPGSIPKSNLQVALAGFPAGTSVHSMAKLGQRLKSKYFKKFDYGPEQNLLRYGSVSPPVYNLSAVTVPTVIIYGRNDGLVGVRDVKWLVRRLPNVLEAHEIRDPLWTHLDFQLSRNIPKLLFPKIAEYLHT